MASRLSISSSAGLRPSPRSWRESSSRTVSSRRSTFPAYSWATALCVASFSNPVWQTMSKSPSLSSSLRESSRPRSASTRRTAVSSTSSRVSPVFPRTPCCLCRWASWLRSSRAHWRSAVWARSSRARVFTSRMCSSWRSRSACSRSAASALSRAARSSLVLPPAHQRHDGHGGQEHGHQIVGRVQQRAGQQQHHDQHQAHRQGDGGGGEPGSGAGLLHTRRLPRNRPRNPDPCWVRVKAVRAPALTSSALEDAPCPP